METSTVGATRVQVVAGKAKEENSQGRTWKNVMVDLQQHEGILSVLERKIPLSQRIWSLGNLCMRSKEYFRKR